MAENVPPGPTAAAAAKPATTAPDTANRGLPYYEKLRRDLRDTIQKKRILDKNLSALEDSIFRLESSYLEDTSPAGNIIKGFDNYIKGSTVSGSGGGGGGPGSGTISGSAAGGTRRKIVIQDTDRVFSRSSTGSMKSAEVGAGGIAAADSPAGSEKLTPASHAGTPTGSMKDGGNNTKAGGNKKPTKKKKAAAIDDDEASATGSAAEGGNKKNKRLKVSYGRE
ncbi:putative chromatin modification-like protein eaf6 [Phaeomoniella chlamydospora]|uniref:Chromatin modification-related protein EAF6 n=1 Tax=Phaeomoniella chlamydospora TaxID=158046 RepID=A0A0G2GQ42_PHACM|nr:putative chromatin modification-like protein eaf6 [Phaeomoniella chlamydospora]